MELVRLGEEVGQEIGGMVEFELVGIFGNLGAGDLERIRIDGFSEADDRLVGFLKLKRRSSDVIGLFKKGDDLKEALREFDSLDPA